METFTKELELKKLVAKVASYNIRLFNHVLSYMTERLVRAIATKDTHEAYSEYFEVNLMDIDDGLVDIHRAYIGYLNKKKTKAEVEETRRLVRLRLSDSREMRRDILRMRLKEIRTPGKRPMPRQQADTFVN